ncbi:MAG: HIT family protein [Gammaproteobacteria bacterium]|nr:MAG: HIT family protein [Gammaproteobacteria bacterium]
MSHCIFCQIIAGQSPAHKVYEDEHLLAFMDLFPAGPGHALLIPKVHAENIFELDEAVMARIGAFSQKLATAVKTAFAADGLVVFQLNGEAAGQTVFHYHMHFLPRMAGNNPMAMHGKVMAEAAVLADHAARIRAALGEG